MIVRIQDIEEGVENRLEGVDQVERAAPGTIIVDFQDGTSSEYGQAIVTYASSD